MKKFIQVCIVIITSTLIQSIVQSVPTQDSPQLRTEDMLMLLLNNNIYEVIGNYYYPRILKLKPEVKPWHISVIDSRRLNGFRGFVFEITIEVEPSLGHGVRIGKDRITYQLSVGSSVKLVNHTHLATYNFPEDIQEWIQDGTNIEMNGQPTIFCKR